METLYSVLVWGQRSDVLRTSSTVEAQAGYKDIADKQNPNEILKMIKGVTLAVRTRKEVARPRTVLVGR